MVINLDAKMWPNAPDSDASAHYKVLFNSHTLYDIFLEKKKVGCFYGNEISSFC